MKKLTLQFALDHPTGVGHFPGNPIIPGALLLAEVLHGIGQAEGKRFSSCNVKAAKFLHPARPGDSVEIEYSRSAQGTLEFQCAVGGAKVLTGAIVASE
jgi:3-hydroxymyristoyl/3-hydroxydecanoyl-(acyl carrier protein) dehydratase